MNEKGHKPKKKEVVHQPVTHVDVSDAWKSACFACRVAVSAAAGRPIGDWKVDDAMGKAFDEMYPASSLAKQGTAWAIGLAALAGAWNAIRRT